VKSVTAVTNSMEELTQILENCHTVVTFATFTYTNHDF